MGMMREPGMTRVPHMGMQSRDRVEELDAEREIWVTLAVRV